MPNYELKDVTYGQVKENGNNTATQHTIVMSGIVGDTYGFNRWDDMKSTYLMTATADEIKAQITAEANLLIATKYPNT